MKKLFLALAVVFMVLLSGCGEKEAVESDSSSAKQEEDAKPEKADTKKEEEETEPEKEQIPDKEDLEKAIEDALNEIKVKEVVSKTYGDYEKIEGAPGEVEVHVETDTKKLIIRNIYRDKKWSVGLIHDADNEDVYYPVAYATGSVVNSEQESEEQKENEENPQKEEEKVTPHRDGMYGISDKKVIDIDAKFSVSDVRNDVTGKWRISTIANNVNMEEYALNYYERYFRNDDEIHAIVNFNYNTTTQISVVGDKLDVSVYEYLDGEEHDAKLLFGGMLLKSYRIYLDNGDIEEIQ